MASAAVAIILTGIAVTSRSTFVKVNGEDGPVEWATFATFIAAAVAFLLVLRLPRPLFEKAGYLALALFCVAVAGEEISWGQRLLGIMPPEIFLEKNFQQEMNLHNLLNQKRIYGFSVNSGTIVAVICIICGAVFPLLIRAKKLTATLPLVAWRPPALALPFFWAVALVKLFHPIPFGGESAELVFGLCFVLWAAALLFRHGASLRFPILWVAIPLGLGVVLTPITGAITHRAGAHHIPAAKKELKLIGEVFATMPIWTKRIATVPLMHQRIFNAEKMSYFKTEILKMGLSNRGLKDTQPRHRYYIDPWGNPYWISFNHFTKEAWVYSFGPNHRRDTEVARKKKVTPAGDDIFVLVPGKKSNRPLERLPGR